VEAISIPTLALRVPDEAAAYEFLEDLRWHGRPVCPHCGVIDGHYFLKPRNGVSRQTRTGAETQRRLWKCRDCRKQFSVLTGTVMHRTKIPVRTWLFVLYEMCASKNGISAREIERKYGLTPRTAWFMAHRVREAMRRGPSEDRLAGTIIADETFIGGKARLRYGTMAKNADNRAERRYPPKSAVVTLIHPESGEARSRVVPTVNAENLGVAIASQVDVTRSRLVTDESRSYTELGWDFADGHETVWHSGGEYVRGNVTTNAVESFFSQLKRSVDGTFHHVSPEHLARYLAEFDYRYTTRKMTDGRRMESLMRRVGGRRLTYSESSEDSSSSLVA
jgi:transposase-like protein